MTKARLRFKRGERPDVFVSSPGYPKTASEVIRSLKKALENAERLPGRELTQKETATLIGAPKSTLHDWYHGNLAAPIKHFLCGVERLPEEQRIELFRGLCRDCPRLDHPRLSHNPEALALVRASFTQGPGLILVTGASDAVRTFVFTAIGNSAAQVFPIKALFGFDVHRPDSWVPVPGVLYFRDPKDTTAVANAIRDHWKFVETSAAEIYLFNSVWTMLPEHRELILDLSRRKVVIVADCFSADALKQINHPILNVIGTEGGAGNNIRLKVSRGVGERDDLDQ